MAAAMVMSDCTARPVARCTAPKRTLTALTPRKALANSNHCILERPDSTLRVRASGSVTPISRTSRRRARTIRERGTTPEASSRSSSALSVPRSRATAPTV
jgi:hypothetical protein